MQLNQRERQTGAVSLFVVIFAALLITIVTVGFIQLMIKDQQQATANDLSQSAYDSAQAGVEDAKRLLLLDQDCRNNIAASTVNCSGIAAALTPQPGRSDTECNTLSSAGLVGVTNNETLIQQTSGDGASKLDQAYTCVKITVNTEDYKGQLDADGSTLVPISGVGEFDTVELSWFSRADVSTETNSPDVGFPADDPDIDNVDLPQLGDKWRSTYPSLMRAQLMQTGGSFKLSDFDDSSAGKSNAHTLFLYPSRSALTSKEFAIDGRRNSSNSPQQVRCNTSFNDSEYVCKVTLQLPAPIDGNTLNRGAYLRLSSLYNGAHYKIKLKRGAEDVRFSRVQPEVDSTGRANDLFRRVKARIELKGAFTFPEAALDMQGDLCKNFIVTDSEAGYSASPTCLP